MEYIIYLDEEAFEPYLILAVVLLLAHLLGSGCVSRSSVTNCTGFPSQTISLWIVWYKRFCMS
ncbi:hypothetical protein DSUL_20114 [Desulfovibrionales bacterium]